MQSKPALVHATKGNATLDISIRLTQGAEIQVTVKFKHQGVFEGLPFDAHLRIRVLNDANKVVGEYLTSDWWWQPQYDWRTGANGELRYTWNLARTTAPAPPAPLVVPNARASGLARATTTVALSDGGFSAISVYLERTNIPIPEFPAATIVLASALVASIFILRRRKSSGPSSLQCFSKKTHATKRHF